MLPDYHDFIDQCLNTPECWASLQNQSLENGPHYTVGQAYDNKHENRAK